MHSCIYSRPCGRGLERSCRCELILQAFTCMYVHLSCVHRRAGRRSSARSCHARGVPLPGTPRLNTLAVYRAVRVAHIRPPPLLAPGRTLLLGGDAPRAARRLLYRRSLSCPAHRVAAAASPAHVRLRVSAAEVCSRTNAQMARCSRRTSSSRSRRAAASAAAAQMRSKRWPVRGARPQGDSACRDLGVHVHVDRLERLPPAPPASPAPRARRLPAPVSSQHGAALTTAARVTVS